MKKLFTLVLLILIIFTGCTQTSKLQTIPLSKLIEPLTKEDIIALDKHLQLRYLDYDAVKANLPEDKKLLTLAQNIESMPLNEQYIALKKSLSLFNDGHLWMNIDDLNLGFLPIVFEHIGDKYFVIHATETYSDLIGKEIISIDDRSMNDWLLLAMDMVAHDNVYGQTTNAIALMHRINLYALIEDQAMDHLSVVIDGKSFQLPFIGSIKDFPLQSRTDPMIRNGSSSILLPHYASLYPVNLTRNDNTLVTTVTLNSLMTLDSSEMSAFAKEVKQFIKDHTEDTVVFDFRTCIGGYESDFNTAFSLSYLRTIADRTFSFVSDTTFSTGTKVPYRMREEAGIPIIGEYTPSSPFSATIGSTSTISEKYSLTISQSNGLYVKRNETPTVIPDYLITAKLSDYLGETDSWYDQIDLQRE